MKIVIIGCGYVGSVVVKFWSQKGYKMIIIIIIFERVLEL